MTEHTCIHCSSSLSARDLAEGWCDSCGKRLPTIVGSGVKRAAPSPAPSDDAPTTGGGWGWVAWSTGAVAILALGALLLVATNGWAG